MRPPWTGGAILSDAGVSSITGSRGNEDMTDSRRRGRLLTALLPEHSAPCKNGQLSVAMAIGAVCGHRAAVRTGEQRPLLAAVAVARGDVADGQFSGAREAAKGARAAAPTRRLKTSRRGRPVRATSGV